MELLASIVLLGLFIVGVDTMGGERGLDQPAWRIAGLADRRPVSAGVRPRVAGRLQGGTDPFRWAALPRVHAAPDLAVPEIVEARMRPVAVLRVGGRRHVHLHVRSH